MSFSALFSLSALADVGLAILLITVIALALRLDRKLKTVRDSSGELRELITGLNAATERAHQAVAQMGATARENKATLGASITRARELSDELTLITQSADSLASRLSGDTKAPEPVRPIQAAAEPDPEPVTEERPDLRKLLAGIR